MNMNEILQRKSIKIIAIVTLLIYGVLSMDINAQGKVDEEVFATLLNEAFQLEHTEKELQLLNSTRLTQDDIMNNVSYKKHPATYGTDAQVNNTAPVIVDFVKKIGQQASESAQEHGLYASITIAQAIIESGSGQSGLSIAPHYNYFGIKGSYNGKSIKLNTLEDDGSGNKYQIQAHFKSYPSILASLEDHDNLLRNGLNGFYHGTWVENTNSYKDAARFLQGSYATDTSYAYKLIKMIEDYNLTRFDKPLSEQDIEWLNSDSMDMWEIPGYEELIINEIEHPSAVELFIERYQ